MGCLKLAKVFSKQQKAQPLEIQQKPNQIVINNTNIQQQPAFLCREDQKRSQKQEKIIRKSFLGKLLKENIKKSEAVNRFTNVRSPHIQFTSSNTEHRSKEVAIRINLQNELETVRKLIQIKGQQLTSCTICTLAYDLKDRQPIMICSNQHSICNQCVKQLYQKQITRCPFDKEYFQHTKLKKNRLIIQILQTQSHRNQVQL